jgi:hypothetical protein
MVYDYEFDTEWIIVKMLNTIPLNTIASANTTRFRFLGKINTPYAGYQAWMSLYAWGSRTKIIAGNLPPTGLSLPGGIIYIDDYWTDALDGRHISVGTVGGAGVGPIAGYIRPLRIRFTNCMEVPFDGEIKIKFPRAGENPITQYGEHINYCRVWR